MKNSLLLIFFLLFFSQIYTFSQIKTTNNAMLGVGYSYFGHNFKIGFMDRKNWTGLYYERIILWDRLEFGVYSRQILKLKNKKIKPFYGVEVAYCRFFPHTFWNGPEFIDTSKINFCLGILKPIGKSFNFEIYWKTGRMTHDMSQAFKGGGFSLNYSIKYKKNKVESNYLSF